MKCIALFVVVFRLAMPALLGQSLSLTGPNREGMLEGASYNITWESRGIRSVSLVAHGTRTPLGTESRGSFDTVIAEGVPATSEAQWTVPLIDAITFFIKAKGYDDSGQLVAIDERGYRFRPAAMADRMADGMYLVLNQRINQRLYVQKDNRITHAYLSSSSRNYEWRPRNSHVQRPHDHAGVFRVLSKTRNHWSIVFQVDMPWAMRYHGGHFIHATSPNLYRNLGEPASSGCNRMTNHDARELYQMTPVGTRVEVIGPEG